MGKMRVYLDADDQPALTFPLFCGALMNCAMVLTPLARPATALQQLLSTLLESFNVDENVIPRAKGLLRHIPSGGSTSLWAPEQSQIPQQEETLQDFRDQSAFQQVIADCTHDQELEELKQEKLNEYYKIPDRLLASFHPDTLALISNKFRMFDVNDTGTVPRQELFALLSCLGMRVDLPDSYTVLAKLPTVVQRSENTDSNGGEITLVQLLQVIEVAREMKRHSATSNLAAIKIRVDRAATNVRGTSTHLSSQNVQGDDDNSNSDSTGISSFWTEDIYRKSIVGLSTGQHTRKLCKQWREAWGQSQYKCDQFVLPAFQRFNDLYGQCPLDPPTLKRISTKRTCLAWNV
ncbi:Hypothetical protein PHPALM_36737 [Phytophthora palmivora]|uniref:EF-hand domain-containing protein n=1 Tax=Phytophthora palmivora TaxID=4796 RepID=A0A2P4WZ78_9STRA|nr:Hypothetical protein PHPALM_36737 [Phytophthora palmivora]